MLIKKLVDQSQYKKIIQEIDGVFFPIDTNWKKVSISVSGGADSALLSFLVCKLITQKNLDIEIHFISNVRMWKTRPWQRQNSIDVFNWIRDRYSNLKFFRHENFIAPEIEFGSIGGIIPNKQGKLKGGDQISTSSYAEYVCHKEQINAWFAGMTKNPPADFSANGMKDRNVDSPKNLEELFVVNRNIWVCHPFRYTTKDWIIKQYIDYKILDLLRITRSCEGEFEYLDYTNYITGQDVPECGRCFWCKEREWGMKQNGLI